MPHFKIALISDINLLNISWKIKSLFLRNIELLRFIFSLFTDNDCINTIHQFIKPFLDNKMSIFEEYGAFKIYLFFIHCQ